MSFPLLTSPHFCSPFVLVRSGFDFLSVEWNESKHCLNLCCHPKIVVMNDSALVCFEVLLIITALHLENLLPIIKQHLFLDSHGGEMI